MKVSYTNKTMVNGVSTFLVKNNENDIGQTIQLNMKQWRREKSMKI